MIGIREWICDLLTSCGALVDPNADGRIGAMLPPDTAASLGVGEWLALDLADDAGDWLDRMERLLPRRPFLVEAECRSVRPPAPIDAASVLASGLAVQNGISRLVEESGSVATYLFFTFQYAIESDDRSMGVVTVCYNTDAGSVVTMPESFLLSTRDLLAETSGVAGPGMPERWYPHAVRTATSAIRKQVAQAEESANRRLARDTERVESYYAGLLAQIGKRIAKKSDDGAVVEKERGRAEATKADRAAKLDDLRRKYALRVRIEPSLLLAARAPVRRFSVRLIRKKEERACSLDWNPTLGLLEPPLCEHCSGAAHPLYLCERMHVLCRNCWVQCPACSRSFCRVCQGGCKCGGFGESPASV
jgi:hypothetical protein